MISILARVGNSKYARLVQAQFLCLPFFTLHLPHCLMQGQKELFHLSSATFMVYVSNTIPLPISLTCPSILSSIIICHVSLGA